MTSNQKLQAHWVKDNKYNSWIEARNSQENKTWTVHNERTETETEKMKFR